MALTPDTNEPGRARLHTAIATGTRTVTATHANGVVPGAAHIEGTSFTVNILEQAAAPTPTSGGPGGGWAIAVVENEFDVANNDYLTAGLAALAPGVLAVRYLGPSSNGTDLILPTSVVLGDNSGTNGTVRNPPITKGGTYRIVLLIGDTENDAFRKSDVDTGITSEEAHADSDGGFAMGGVVAALGFAVAQRQVGVCGHRLVNTARTPTAGNWKYRQTNQVAISLRPANALSAALIANAAGMPQVKVAVTTGTGGGTFTKLGRVTPNTTGDATFGGILVDTDFQEVVGGLPFHVQLAVNDNFGDSATPAAEAAGIYSKGTPIGTTPSQRSAFYFAATGHVAGTTVVDASRIRSSTPPITASAAIQLFKNAARTIPGVGVFATNAYAVAQDICKRTGPALTTNAVPFLETYIADAYGDALANVSNGFSAHVRRPTDSTDENTQTLSTDAAGRVRWNYTVAAAAPAFNRWIKAGAARVAGGHAATGPDNPLSPPATFSNGNGAYAGPFPAYARNVVIFGAGFSPGKEPVDAESSVFGLNSELIFEDIWTGPIAAAVLDANGVPTEAGGRLQTLGAGSLKAKLTTLVNEANFRVIDVAEHHVKDAPGRNLIVTTDNIFLRRALWNDTSDAVVDAGTNLTDAATKLDNALGYHGGSNSLDTIAAPADGGDFVYGQGGADTTAQRATFALSADGTNAAFGFTGDAGNFGYFLQPITFAPADLSIAIVLTPKASHREVGETQRFGAKVVRITGDDVFVDLHADAVIYGAYGLNADGSQTLIGGGGMTPIGNPATTADYFLDLMTPPGYAAIKVKAFAKVSGGRTPGGDSAVVIVGMPPDLAAHAALTLEGGAHGGLMPIYFARIKHTRLSATVDRYVVVWLRNGVIVTAGITDANIRVQSSSGAGADVIPLSPMTEIGATQTFRYDTLPGQNLPNGMPGIPYCEAVIDGGVRRWPNIVARDK